MNVVRRIARALHAWLGRRLAEADQPVAPKRKSYSWFDCEPGAFAPPKSADEEEAEAFYRTHFKSNGRPLP